MEADDQKGLERVLSQKALAMSSSFPCQICVVGFLSGVCLTSLFLAALTSFGRFEFGGIQLHQISATILPWNSNSPIALGESSSKPLRAVEKEVNLKGRNREKVSLLYSAWSTLLNESLDTSTDPKASVPNAPHLENCKSKAKMNRRLDTRYGNATFPPWTLWKGSLDTFFKDSGDEQLNDFRHQDISEGANPPWVTGSNDENYPLTRKVQRDIWLHQHPLNCHDPEVKFLVADWERLPGFGMGAQIAGMCGLLALAIAEKRVLVTNYYNRADHDGCKVTPSVHLMQVGLATFLPEASRECRERAFELTNQKEAWNKGIIKAKENYTSKEIWAGRTPRNWGTPWSYLQPTTEINGSLLKFHRKMDRRWWRAQAVRYLMRFPTEYTCQLMNAARHAAFGNEAAEMVLESYKEKWPKEDTDIEKYVWANHKAWIPRPLLSMHVRMGDKACEMKVVEFKEYMRLASRIRKQFPNLKSIWLSTEMQQVVDLSKLYASSGWKFYFTNVQRQVSNITMATYEASLGRKMSTEYPLVNFLMATEADYFIGALGSTWCFLIDGMRNTGGKVMAGYLSVNKDRFW
ncbi:Shikimate dehydrogenase (NADP(+)) [Bienertia sinuspersici]